MEPAANLPDPNGETTRVFTFPTGELEEMTYASHLVELASAHRESMEAYAFAILRRWPQAQDVAQEVLLVVYHRAADCEDETNLWPWLRRITQLKCYEVLRRIKKRQKLVDGTLHDLIEQDLNLSKAVDRDDSIQDRIEALKHCLNKLSPKARSILNDFYVENKEGHDIADDRKMRPNTVWSYLHRSRQQLRKCIDQKLNSTAKSRGEVSLSKAHRNLLDQYFSTTYPHPTTKSKIENLIRKHPGVYAAYAAEWSAMANGLMQFEASESSDIVRFASEKPARPWIKAAAAVALLGIGIIWLIPEADTPTSSSDASSDFAVNSSGHIIPETHNGLLRLDGGETRLNIAPGSVVRPLPTHSDTGGTHLALDRGAITANVAPQQGKTPFRIETPQAGVEVIGTRLNVRTTPTSTRVGVDHGIVNVYPGSNQRVRQTPLTLAEGELAFIFPRFGTVKFDPLRSGSRPPWSAAQIGNGLSWDFRNHNIDEASSLVAMGGFPKSISKPISTGRRFQSTRDLLACTPVALPEKFRISARVKLDDTTNGIRTILSNSPISLAADGFRFGFNFDKAKKRFVLRINFGNGKEANPVHFTDGKLEAEKWHRVSAEINLEKEEVRLFIDDQASRVKPIKVTDFKRIGTLYIGSQEPSKGTSPLGGEIQTLNVEPMH